MCGTFVVQRLWASLWLPTSSERRAAAAAVTPTAAAPTAAAAAALLCLLLLCGDSYAFSRSSTTCGGANLLRPCSINGAAASAARAHAAPIVGAAQAPGGPAAAAAAPAAAAAAAAAATARKPLGTSRLLHVRLLCLNLDAMVSFYTELLGMSVLGRWGPHKGATRAAPLGAPPGSAEASPHLWGPLLGGQVTVPGKGSLPVDAAVLLGYRDDEGELGPPQGTPKERAPEGPPHVKARGLKLELIYSKRWANQQKEVEDKAAAALKEEETALHAAVTAFQRHTRMRPYDHSSSSNSSSSNSSSNSSSGRKLLPSLSRMRAFERRRGRHDRGHHGYLGLTFLLPSLKHLQQQRVQQTGGLLLNCVAKRRQVPSMIPDQDARQEVWGRSCFLLDPDGNGVEVEELNSSSSCSSIGRREQERRQETVLNTWHSYMAEQEADIKRQQAKQQLLQQLASVDAQLQQQQPQRQQQQQQEQRAVLKQQQQELQKQLKIFEDQQRVLDELEQQQRRQQQEKEASAAGAAVQHKGPLSPRLQKIRLYTSSHVRADRFFGTTMQMHHWQHCCCCYCCCCCCGCCCSVAILLRYKSHLLERLHPWTRFAATSRTFACEAEALAAKAAASEGAAAAAAAAAAAQAAAGEEGLYGGGSTVPTEWEGPAATDLPAAAAEVFRTEAAERAVPQLQVVYAYDEDVGSIPTKPKISQYNKHSLIFLVSINLNSLRRRGGAGNRSRNLLAPGLQRLHLALIAASAALRACCACKVSVHPSFLHIAFAVEDVSAAADSIDAADAAAAAVAAASAAAEASAQKAEESCKPCSSGPGTATAARAAQIVADAEDELQQTEILEHKDSECLLRNFDGFPILLVTEGQAAAYYGALASQLSSPKTHAGG
ncbi:hypothetical protein ACSSS7_006358 [Eimeria intestinalis]